MLLCIITGLIHVFLGIVLPTKPTLDFVLSPPTRDVGVDTCQRTLEKRGLNGTRFGGPRDSTNSAPTGLLMK